MSSRVSWAIALGRRRATGVAAVLLVCAGVLVCALPLLDPGSGHRVGAALRAASCAAAVVLLHERVRRVDDERDVWRWFRHAAAVAVLGALLDVVPGPGASGVAPSTVTSLVSCALLYRGLIVWNRISTRTTDPSDWLNGLSAILAVAAVGDLVLARTGWDAGGTVAVQLLLVGVGSLFVVLGTTLTVASMGALLRDPRPWLLAAGAGAALTGLVLDATTRSTCWAAPGTTVLLLATAGASRLPVRPSRPQPATTQSLTIGAFVVLLAAVTVLVLDTRLAPALTTWSVVCASVAVVGVSFRVVHLIGDLASLAVRRQEALTDELTGLANRRAFARALADRDTGPLTLLVLDLDRFKEVNDRYGHLAGDRLLTDLAGRLAAAVPEGTLLCRLGGDEFAVLHPAEDDAAALGLAWALFAAAGSDDQHRVRVSIGVARAGDGGDGGGVAGAAGGDDAAQELFRRADTAMYQAKSTGSGVRLYDQGLDVSARERARVADELHRVWDSGDPSGFEVFYQPQVSLADGTASGVEALVRWRHPERGLLGPGAFLDVLEEEGLMGHLTTHVLARATADLQRWHAAGHEELSVSVNLSTSCLLNPDLLPHLQGLARSGFPVGHLVLEVTETALMQDGEASLALCHALRREGFGLSIDDYGTGYSSLAYLSDLPATELKVDRSFTSRLLSDAGVRAIVAATVDLGHRLGLRVVAEGAEDEATLDVLAGFGCDEVQGFVHARPMPADDLFGWLEAARGRSTGQPPRAGLRVEA
ncbi:putative bifunctional diguanylate cyclase/phosphodiesterase [Kineococcus rhizosphaerae]|uniref:Diguanylate cyclase (GGDEF)-like protein n=1 Tax=Kineococcus rhizosphaerae TaxID=559628 RepID=A0A2T0RBI0_9ACTN|nr:bifunctional diguanylate cyclase/phosphodiesterase [Kineococcus rhizosphaerae]PRY18513.1 diguanylate cyclase (GGDEF)-like protein [Kineococcus rhizosphaerae]